MVSDKALAKVSRVTQTMTIVTRQSKKDSFCLVVEDNLDYASVVTAMLSYYGMPSKSVSNSDDAMTILHEDADKIICAIVDLELGETNGEDVIREIGRIAPKVPTVCHTGSSVMGGFVHDKYPRVNVVLKGSSLNDLVEALGIVEKIA